MRVLLTSLLLVLVADWVAHAAEVRTLQARDTEPIIAMQGKDIVACGIKVRFGESQDVFEFDLALRKVPSGSVIHARLSGPSPVADFKFTSASDNPSPFAGSNLAITAKGAERETATSTSAVAPFLRDFFVQGQEIAVGLADGRAFDLVIPGPVSNSVRAAYLGCAGDFYR